MNAIEQPVLKKGPKCLFCGFARHTEEKCWKKHSDLRKPLIFKSGESKSGTGPGNPTFKGTGSPKECSDCRMKGQLVDQRWKKHPYLKADFEARRAAKRTKSQGRQRPGKVTPGSHVKKALLKVDFVLDLKRARLCTVQLTDAEPVRLREPRPGSPKRPRRGVILSGAYTIDNTPGNVLRDIATLIDSGCEVLAVAGWEIFNAMHYTKAEFPIRLVGAGKNRLAAGSQVVK